ncbi:MAG: MATE family efflux transporter [Castellaniella sp.]
MLEALPGAWRRRNTHAQVWALALPMILSNLTVPLVALVGSTVVGHLPHAWQLGAVALALSFYTLVVSVSGFLRMGTTGLAAQAAGRDDARALRRILLQSLTLAALLSGVLAGAAWPLAQLAFAHMHISDALHVAAQSFLGLRLWGLPGMLVQFVLVGWFLGRQDARTPLAIMWFTNGINIVLTPALVLGMDMGIAGAAVAGIAAEYLGAAMGLWRARRWLAGDARSTLDRAGFLAWQHWHPLLAINRDIFLRTLALEIVFLGVAMRGAQLGDAVVAANALLLNGLRFASHALDGLAHAVEALCGRAIGRGDRQALLAVLVVAGGWSLMISLVFSLVFLALGQNFIDLQTDLPAVRAAAADYLPWLALLPVVAVWSYLLDGLFIGATRAREMRDAMLVSLLLTLPLAWWWQGLGNHGLWMALLAFMAWRALSLGWVAWRLARRDAWVGAAAATAT